MRILQRLTGIGSLAAILLALPESGYAQFCTGGITASGSSMCAFIQDHIITQGLTAFYGIAAAFIFYYAVRIVLQAWEDKTLGEATTTFIHAFVGFCVIALSAAFANAFHLAVNPSQLNGGIASISTFIITAAAGVFVLMVVIAGMRMITTQGDSGAFQKWTKVLVYNCVGVVIMFIAFFIVHAVTDVNSGLIVEELRGLALFLLTIIGFTCVLALIIAGIFLIISIDESYKDRAKKIIIGTLIALLIVVSIYTLIYTFVV